MREQTVKNWIFAFLLIGKLIILLCIFVKYKQGGLTRAEANIALTAIMPLFVANIGLALKDLFKNRELKKKQKQRLVKKSILPISLGIITIYVLAFIYIILAVSQGDIQNITLSVNFVESLFGAYVVIIVQSFFGEEKKEKD